MSDGDDWLAGLKAKAGYLEEWLDRYAAMREVAPIVQRNLDFTKWQIQTMESRPPGATCVELPDLGDTVGSDAECLSSVLRLAPVYDRQALASSTSFTDGETASVYRYAAQIGQLEAPEAVAFWTDTKSCFRHLQETHHMREQLRGLIEGRCGPATVQRFDAAFEQYQSCRIGALGTEAAALAMRNALDGIKGDLWGRARKFPRENMTWPTMAERLACGGSSSPQSRELVKLADQYGAQISRLSDTLKDRVVGRPGNVDDLWADLQNYLVALLGLVSPRSA